MNNSTSVREWRFRKRATLMHIRHGNSTGSWHLYFTGPEGLVVRTYTVERRPKSTVITIPRRRRSG